jgi:hypothetical protein
VSQPAYRLRDDAKLPGEQLNGSSTEANLWFCKRTSSGAPSSAPHQDNHVRKRSELRSEPDGIQHGGMNRTTADGVTNPMQLKTAHRGLAQR